MGGRFSRLTLRPSPPGRRRCDTPVSGQSPRCSALVDLPFSPHKMAVSFVEFSAEPPFQQPLALSAPALGMIDLLRENIRIERIDDVPLLLAQLRRMHVIRLLDQHFPTHGNWAGELTFGEVAAVWLASIVSTGDHRLNQLQDWAADRLEMLAACLGKPVRSEDFHDDRLADLLDALSQPTVWAAFEQELNAGLVRVYQLPTETVRVDTTTASTYATPDDTGEGLFQFGHSKDHRPDLPQIKVPIAALDPLGMPLITTVVAGNTADDPLYVPTIAQVQQSLSNSGRLFVGDCKMAAVETRGYVVSTGNFYLCPLSAVQVPKAELQPLLQPVWEGKQPLMAVYRPVEDPAEVPEEVARGFEYTVTETATIAGQTLSWTERRLVVCSLGQARRQAAALGQRLKRATAELEGLNRRKRGKKLLTARGLRAKAERILARHQVAHLIDVRVQTIQTERPRRRYRDRPADVVVLRQVRVRVQVNQAAVEIEKQQFGWRVYVTNHSDLTLSRAVLGYRGQYGIEHGFSRLKGKSLGLSPMYLQIDSRVVGLVHLLSIGLRVLTLVEYVVRRNLAARGEKLRGVYAGQAGRGTSRPGAELLLAAFRGLDLRVVAAEGVRYRTVSPLTAVQKRILELLEIPSHVYKGLEGTFSDSG
jgi:transposase